MWILTGEKMVYCSNCGTKIEDEAYFCYKCGTKTQVGKNAKAMYPSDELRDAFYQVGLELEKAFTMAARETQSAFKKVSENMQQKTRHSQVPKKMLYVLAAEQRMVLAQFSATTAAQK